MQSIERNRRVILATRPSGIPQASNFEIDQAPIPPLEAGQVLVRNEWLSVEPAMRGWVSAVRNYTEPVPLGSVMKAFAAGRIVGSADPAWRVGTAVTGLFGWQEYAAVESSSLRRVTEADLPLSTCLGVLGLNGLTAHYGMLSVGRPRSGDTVAISSAAGSVGSCAGQIAKLKGCRTVGIAGGPRKTRQCLEDFGFDEAVDYKAADFEEKLAIACSSGVDVYFDCTAGAISDAVMRHLNVGARVAVCGTASVSSWDPAPLGPRPERTLLVKRARIEGFVILDHQDKFDAAREDLAAWIRAGKIRYAEDVLDGIESAPDSIAGLYRGENMGKRLIRLNTDGDSTKEPKA